MRLGLAAAIGLMLLMPLAAAQESHGTFEVAGPVNFTAGATVSGDPLALLANLTPRDRMFTLTASTATVYVREARDINLVAAFYETITRDVSYELHDVNVTFGAGGTTGWWGAYATSGSHLDMTFVHEADLEAKTATRISTEALARDQTDPTPTSSYYSRHLDMPHLEVHAPATMSMSFGGGIKFFGPDLRLQSRENTTEIQTGFTQEAWPKALTWVTLVFDDARLVAASPDCHVGFAEGATRSEGTIRFSSEDGAIETGAASYGPAVGPTFVTGTFQGHASPVVGGAQRGAMRLELAGELSSTTLPGKAITSTMLATPFRATSWLWVGGGLALAAVGALAGTQVMRRRSREPALGLDELVQMADLAAEAGRFAEALDWVRKARAQAPRSARLCVDEAFYLASLGEVDEALARYEEATGLSEDGEAPFLAAQLVAATQGPASEVAKLLRVGLGRTPTLVLDAEDDEALAAYARDPAIARILREARARLGDA